MFDLTPTGGFDITSLNLSGVKAATTSSTLPPGRHRCVIKSVKLEATKANDGKFLAVLLGSAGGQGVITARLNIVNKSAEAQRIGMEQLRALAENCGVPDANQPFAGGMTAMNGLEVGVVVKAETYQGEKRSAVSGFCSTKDCAAPGSATAGVSGAIGTDDIPF